MELARRRWSRCPTSPSTPTGCAPLRPPSLQLPPEPCSPAGARPPLPPPPSRPRRTGEGEIEPSSPRSRERALSKNVSELSQPLAGSSARAIWERGVGLLLDGGSRRLQRKVSIRRPQRISFPGFVASSLPSPLRGFQKELVVAASNPRLAAPIRGQQCCRSSSTTSSPSPRSKHPASPHPASAISLDVRSCAGGVMR